jgi:hypothetical protein
MGHCISAIVIKEENIKDGYKEYIKLPQGFALLHQQEDNSMLIEPYLEIDTDYFGGCGEQYATLFSGGYKKELEGDWCIDEGLKILGVIKDETDEFDAINLGHYRDYQDIEKELPNYDGKYDISPDNEDDIIPFEKIEDPLKINITIKFVKDEKGNYTVVITEEYNDKINGDIEYDLIINENI